MLDKTQVALVDHNTLLRESLLFCLSREPEFEFSWAVDSMDDALQAVQNLPPKVLILDVETPGKSPYEITRRVSAAFPHTKIAILTNNSCDAYVSMAMKLNVAGYLLKSESLCDLVGHVKKIAAGERRFSPSITKRIRFDSTSDSTKITCYSRLLSLTERQLEILKYLAQGDSVKDVAKYLHISEKSVDSHKYRIMQKLDIHDRVHLARFAIREGLTAP